jgi:hypothetical protein
VRKFREMMLPYIVTASGTTVAGQLLTRLELDLNVNLLGW